MKKNLYRTSRAALAAGCLGLTLTAGLAAAPSALAARTPAPSAPTEAPARTAGWAGFDFSPLFTMKGVTYTDRPDSEAVITKDCRLRAKRALSLTATARKARSMAAAMRARVGADQRYKYVSSVRQGDHYIYVYAHKGGWDHDEILVFDLSDDEARIIQLRGNFSNNDLTRIAKALKA